MADDRDLNINNHQFRKDETGELNEEQKSELQRMLDEGWTKLGEDNVKVVLHPPPGYGELRDGV